MGWWLRPKAKVGHARATIGVLRAALRELSSKSESQLSRVLAQMLALSLVAMSVAGCQKPVASTDRYGGLSQAILAWRGDIASTPVCNAKLADGAKGCQAFTVGCKVEQPFGADDVGASAKVLVGMSWDAWNPVSAGYEPSSGGAVFVKTNGQWVRHDLNRPINLGTCATS
jgi:hypothetical protein